MLKQEDRNILIVYLSEKKKQLQKVLLYYGCCAAPLRWLVSSARLCRLPTCPFTLFPYHRPCFLFDRPQQATLNFRLRSHVTLRSSRAAQSAGLSFASHDQSCVVLCKIACVIICNRERIRSKTENESRFKSFQTNQAHFLILRYRK